MCGPSVCPVSKGERKCTEKILQASIPNFFPNYDLTMCTLWGVNSVMIFCRTFLTWSTGHWADTADTVQPNGYNRNFKKKTKQNIMTE